MPWRGECRRVGVSPSPERPPSPLHIGDQRWGRGRSRPGTPGLRGPCAFREGGRLCPARTPTLGWGPRLEDSSEVVAACTKHLCSPVLGWGRGWGGGRCAASGLWEPPAPTRLRVSERAAGPLLSAVGRRVRARGRRSPGPLVAPSSPEETCSTGRRAPWGLPRSCARSRGRVRATHADPVGDSRPPRPVFVAGGSVPWRPDLGPQRSDPGHGADRL